ncbi:YfhO family protein [Aerococcus sp. UMB1112A]|uniref:YfhO family protein n=1 Tax=Aerococcus sp. UMB1112A TaxID=3050609 RepID=UPI00254F7866|nr:YfhO family protein [Aerococcus sp. UMB1112A]MDK8502483.1 YfhO family protein [Aerococcus sp. UMB1112A]
MNLISRYYQTLKENIHQHPLAWSLVASFGLPFVILMVFYFFGLGLFPFGDGSLYTVDLGQQYIDFYAYYRNVLLGQWDQALYSFQKALGGEMIGTWTYYLMSPYLLILLLFPKSWMTLAVALIIAAKIGTAGASFQYLLAKHYGDISWRSLSFAFAYALIGYVSANQLNVMWLDAYAFLPLVVYGLEKLLKKGSWPVYILSLAYILIANYYMGYMVCLFLALYMVYALIRDFSWPNWQASLKQVWRFTWTSLAAAGLAALVLLPSYQALSLSKGTYASEVNWEWELAYPIQDLLSKFYLAPFNFDQMPEGLPNVYIGSLGLIALALYFSQKKIPRQEKWGAGLVLFLLILSMNVKALNIIWHGFQPPIWYPYRFSFVFSFFCLFLAYRGYRHLRTFHLKTALILLGLFTASTVYVLSQGERFDYLQGPYILASFVLFILCNLMLFFIDRRPTWSTFLIYLLTVVELSANTCLTLSAISYLSHSEVADYNQLTEDFIEELNPASKDFYRISKLFQRTKNDPMQLNYYGLSHFNSTIEKSTTELFRYLGLPTSEGFVSYNNGTLITDAFFGVRYLVESKSQTADQSSNQIHLQAASSRPDTKRYPLVQSDPYLMAYENDSALPLAYSLPREILDLKLHNAYPILLQDQLLQVANRQAIKDYYQYFQVASFAGLELDKVESADPKQINTHYRKTSDKGDAWIHFDIQLNSNDSYYLTVPGHLNEDDLVFYLDGEPMAYEKSFNSVQVYNLAANEAGQSHRFSIKLLADDLDLNNVNLYRLNPDHVRQMAGRLQASGLKIDKFSNRRIQGQVESQENQDWLVFTLPYNQNWTFTVDGKKVASQPVLDGGFTAIPLGKAGKHQISLSFWPSALTTGLIVSATTAGLLILLYCRDKKK